MRVTEHREQETESTCKDCKVFVTAGCCVCYNIGDNSPEPRLARAGLISGHWLCLNCQGPGPGDTELWPRPGCQQPVQCQHRSQALRSNIRHQIIETITVSQGSFQSHHHKDGTQEDAHWIRHKQLTQDKW